MYSYSINNVFGSNAEIAIRSILERFFAANVNTLPKEYEYEQTDTCEDTEDIYQSLNGNHEAYKRLVEKYEQAIAKTMWRFSRDELIHEELVQDVFVEAYLSLRSFKEQAPFLHWLRKIATRVGYRYWKELAREHSKKHFTLQEWDEVLSQSPEKIDSEQAGKILHYLLVTLPPRDRLVLTLRFVEGLSVEQAAYRTGWSKSMVKVQTIRAKRKLKKMFPNA